MECNEHFGANSSMFLHNNMISCCQLVRLELQEKLKGNYTNLSEATVFHTGALKVSRDEPKHTGGKTRGTRDGFYSFPRNFLEFQLNYFLKDCSGANLI